MSRFNFNAQNRIFIPHSFTKLLALIFIFCMMSCVTAQATSLVSIKYIDANGNEQEVDATQLDGTETELTEGWYIAQKNTPPSYTHTITLGTNADVRIILADDATMAISVSDKGISTNASELGHLYIYGQTDQTGTLNITTTSGNAIDVLNYTQYGGNVKINSSKDGIVAASRVNINSGNLEIKAGDHAINAGHYADGWLYTGYITIDGGTVSADKDFYAGYNDYGSLKGTITLGLSGNYDYIKAGSYQARTVRVNYGQTLSDDTRTYSGILTSTEIDAMKGKTLKWANLYSYIDENGNEKHVTATPLKSHTTRQVLKDGWYIVNEDVTMQPQSTEASSSNSTAFIIDQNANVRIILADDKTMTIQQDTYGKFRKGFEGYGTLTIYGQTAQTGTLKINTQFTITNDRFTQNGGNIIISVDKASASGSYGVSGIESGRIDINNGTLSIDIKKQDSYSAYAIRSGITTTAYGNAINLNGGKVSIKGAGLLAEGTTDSPTIRLGYRNASDYISATSFDAVKVEVVGGQILTISGDNSGKLLSGDITASKDYIAGKILVPYDTVYTISYDYGLNDGESLLNEGYLMIVSLDEAVDGLSMQIGDKEEELISSGDKRIYFALLSSSDVLTSTFALRAKDSSSTTTYLFVSDSSADDLTEGTHDIALNYSTVKGKYVIAGLDAGLLNPFAYSTQVLPLTLQNPARRGYTFNSWTVDPSSVTITDGIIPAGTNANLKLTANWTLNTYTITYAGADGMTPTTYTVSDDTFTLDNPTKDDYTFVGWTGTGLDGATRSVTIPAGSTGNRTYTAVWQKSFTPKAENTPEIPQHSMILGSQIVVVFHVYLPDSVKSADYTMDFDVSGDKAENPGKTPAFEAITEGSHTLYGYKCYVNSVQMADTIHAKLYSGDNVVLSEDYTAKRYLDRVIASKDVFTAKTVNLCKAIKNYGSYVQIPLAAENGWTIGSEHAKMDSADKYDDDAVLLAKQGVSDYAVSKDSYAPTFSYALYLDSVTTLEVSFDSTIKDLACASGDVSNDIVTISDISAHELGNVYTITGKNGDNAFTVEISPLSYVKSVLEDTSIEGKCPGIHKGVISLYDYYYRTMRYRTKHSAE